MNGPQAASGERDQLAQDFVQFAIESGVLRFGEFKTKAGRMSPYFFNAGLFDDGAKLGRLAQFYARALLASGIEFDVLFGPAYKGIPLGAAVAVELARLGVNKPFAYNRKEAKDHGEGGTLVGAALDGRRVLVVDDVLTAGTAVREALELIRAAGGIAAGVAIALDRQEVLDEAAADRRSAATRVAAGEGVPVVAIASLADLLAFTGESATLSAERERLLAYRARYGSAAT